MPSPRSHIALAVIAASAIALTTATPAFAKNSVAARGAAISACRTAVAASLEPDSPSLRLDTLRSGPREIQVRYVARKDGASLGTFDCTYSVRERTATLANAQPATQTAAVPATAVPETTAK